MDQITKGELGWENDLWYIWELGKGSRLFFDSVLSERGGAMELPRQGRSQMEFGNEGRG